MAEVKKEAVQRMGIDFKFSDNNSILVSSVPNSMVGLDIKIIIDELISASDIEKDFIGSLNQNSQNIALSISGRIVNTRAKKFEDQEIESLLGSLFSSSNCNYTSNGKKIIHKISLEQVKGYFE